MATAAIQHRVKEYDAWRRVYDSVADMQKAGGVEQRRELGGGRHAHSQLMRRSLSRPH